MGGGGMGYTREFLEEKRERRSRSRGMSGDVVVVDGVGAGAIVPSRTFGYGVPLGFGAGEIDVGQPLATAKRILVNTGYTVRNDNRGDSGAVVERVLVNTCHAVGNDD